MTTYSIVAPDGNTYEIEGPEGASQADVAQAVLAKNPQAGQPRPETTIKGNVKEAFKGVIPGAVNLLRTAGIGASALLPEEQEKSARATMNSLADSATSSFAPAPGYEDSIGRNLGEGVGSTLPFLAAGPLGLVGRGAMAALGVAAGAGEARQNAEAKGITGEDRATATMLGAPVGLADMLIGSIKPFKSMLTTALARGGVEGLTEAAQKLAQNLIAKGVYDPAQPLLTGAGEEGAYGAGVGALSSLIMDTVMPGRRMAAAPRPGAPKPVEETPPGPLTPEQKADIQKRYDAALAQRDVLQEQAKALAKSKDPADQLLYKQAQEAVRMHVREVLNPVTAEFAPLRAEINARPPEAPPAAAAPEAPKMPDGTPIPTNPLDVRRVYDTSVAELTAAKQRSKDALQSGDMGLFAEADAAAEQQAQLVRTLQPFLSATPNFPKMPSLQDMLEDRIRLIGGKTAKGSKVKGVMNSAIDVQDRPLIKQYSEELAELNKKIAAAQRGENLIQERQADLGAQTVAPDPVNPMADFQADIDAFQAVRPRQLQEAATGNEIAEMEAGRMPTAVTAQTRLFTPEEDIAAEESRRAVLPATIPVTTETTYPKAPTITSLQKQLAQLPPAVQEQNAEMLTRLQDNLPAVAANPERVAQVSDWLYGLRTGRATNPVTDEMAADAGRSQEIGGMLDALDAGKMSETEQVLESRGVPLTPEQKQALMGTQNRRNRVDTPTMVPTGEVKTASQKDIFPQEQIQGKLFPTVRAFQNFMGGETLNKMRVKAGETVQTLSRALRMTAPIERRIGLLEENAVREQEGYQRAIATGERGGAAAEASHAAAQSRLKTLVQKLDVELQPLQIQWMEARNALKAAAENSFDVADTWYQNATKFGTVKEDAAEAMNTLVKAKGRLAEAVSQPVSKKAWDEMRAAQTAIPEAASFFETHRAALPEEVNRFLAADRKTNAALEQAIITEGRLREVYDSARAALDRVANNQQRRKSVQETKASTEAEMRYQTMMKQANVKAAQAARALAAERASRAEAAVRGARGERDAILTPVMDAQAKRTAVVAPGETQADADARVQAQAEKENASRERLAALPGRAVDAGQRRDWMNQLQEADAEIARGRTVLQDSSLTDTERASAVTELNRVKRTAEILRTKLEQEEGQLAALQPKLVKKAAQVERLAGSEKGGIDEEGIEPATRASRVKELNKARKALANMRQAAAKQSGIKVREKGEMAPEREGQTVADALAEAQDKLEDAKQNGDKRKEAYYTQQVKILESGTLPSRKVGPLVKPVVNAGEIRTGTTESKAGELRTGAAAKIVQSGTPRSVTSKQAQREGNAASLEREATEGLDEETLRLKEEAAKDREAVAAAKAAPKTPATRDGAKKARKLTAAEKEEIEAELDAEYAADMAKEDARAASIPDDGRTTTSLSAEGAALAEDGQIINLLEHIAETSTSPERRAQAKALAKLVLRTKLRVEDDLMLDGEPAAGVYAPKTNTITLDRKAMSEEDFIHEVYHAATDSTLLADPDTLTPRQRQARKEIEGMYEALRNNPAFKGVHAAASAREFVAEVKTNDALRAQLQATGKPTTLWQRLVNAVKRLLKMDDVSKADRLIEAMLQPSRKIDATATPSLLRKPSSTLPAALTDLGKYVHDERTTLDKAKELKSSAMLAFRQAAADMRASLRETFTYGDAAKGSALDALVSQRDSIMNVVQAVAERGAVAMTKDAKGNVVVNSGHSDSLKDVLGAIAELPVDADATEKVNLYQRYRIARRAQSVGWDKLDFDDPAAAKAAGLRQIAAIDADPALKAALKAVDKHYDSLNKGLIKFLDQTHALEQDVINKLMQDPDYVPYYRVNGDTVEALLPDGKFRSIGDIRTQPFLQELVGGEQKLMNFTESIMRNIATLTSLGMDNLVSKEVAYHLQSMASGTKKMVIQHGKGAANQDIVRFHQKPDPNRPGDDGNRHIKIDTKGTVLKDIPTTLLVQSLAGSYGTMSMLEKAGAVAAQYLRSGVTRNPLYILRQLIRDPLHASITGNTHASPLVAVMQSFRNFAEIVSGNSKESDILQKYGVTHSNIFSGDSSDYTKMERMLAGDQQGWWDRVKATADRYAAAADAATRVQVYKDSLAGGSNETQAVHAARELMNFNRRGSSQSVQFLSHVIPFFNAQIQGLDLLYRSASGKMPAQELFDTKQTFFNRAMSMAALSFMYAWMMEDDPEWASQTLYQKMASISVPNIFNEDGENLKLPTPFETGLLFFSLPVALVQNMKRDFSREDMATVGGLFANQLPGGSLIPIPQIAKGALDVYRNYNSLTGLPIESAGQKRLDADQRYTERTTELAKEFSSILNAAGVRLSPIQMEYLSNAYLGQLPLAVAGMVDMLFEDETLAEKPTKGLNEWPLIGTLFSPAIGSDASSHAYEKAGEATTARNTLRHLLASGQREEALQYREKHKAEIAAASAADAFMKRMSEASQRMKAIRAAERGTMTPDEKKAQLDHIKKMREKLGANFLDGYRGITERAEQSDALQ